MKFTPTNQNQLNDLTNLALVKDGLFSSGYWCALDAAPPADHVVDHEGITPFTVSIIAAGGWGPETLISDTLDTPFMAGNNYFQITAYHLSGLGGYSDWVRMRIAHDNGGVHANYAAAVAAGDYFEVICFLSFGVDLHWFKGKIQSPLIPTGSKVWVSLFSSVLMDEDEAFSYEIIEYTI